MDDARTSGGILLRHVAWDSPLRHRSGANVTAGIVIEAIPEDVALKRRLFAELGAHVEADALIATNTSAIRLAALADAVPDSRRFVGLHDLFAAASNTLFEIVRAVATSDATFERAADCARATHKVGLACRDSNGFIVNRFFVPRLNEAVRLDDEGANRAAIEAAGRAAFAAPVGPFKLFVLTKTAIALHAAEQLAALGGFYGAAPGLARQWQPAPNGYVPSLTALPRRAAIELGAAAGLRWGSGPVAAFRAGRARGLRCVAAIAARYNAAVPRSLAGL